jgi:hypothetical protein
MAGSSPRCSRLALEPGLTAVADALGDHARGDPPPAAPVLVEPPLDQTRVVGDRCAAAGA